MGFFLNALDWWGMKGEDMGLEGLKGIASGSPFGCSGHSLQMFWTNWRLLRGFLEMCGINRLVILCCCLMVYFVTFQSVSAAVSSHCARAWRARNVTKKKRIM